MADTNHNSEVVIDENNGHRSEPSSSTEVVETIDRDPATIISRLVVTVTGIITALIALRVLLTAFGANRDNGFADFIYSVTHPLVSPFFGLFNQDIVYADDMGIEAMSIFAIVVYWLIAWAIVGLISVAGRRNRRLEIHR